MSDYSDLDRQIEQLKRCEIIKENEVKALCAKAREILVEEGNVQRVDSPVTVSLFLFFLLRRCSSASMNHHSPFVSCCRSAVIFMGNFTISRSFLKSVAMCRRQIIYLWVIS
jgi:hypothetical protein